MPRVGAHAVRDARDAAGARRLLVRDRVRRSGRRRAGRRGGRASRRPAPSPRRRPSCRTRRVRRGCRRARPACSDRPSSAPWARRRRRRCGRSAGGCGRRPHRRSARRSCGRPSKSSANGTWRPRTSSGRGSQTSTAAPAAREPLGEMRLQRGLVARRVARVARRRVEADQRGGELDELVAALGDRLGDALLEVVHRSSFKRRRVMSRSCTSTRNARAAALRIAERLEPQPRRVVARQARDRVGAPCASSHSACGTSSVVCRPSSSPAARTAPKSTSTVMSCVPGAGQRIAPRHAADVRAQPRAPAARSARRPPRRSRGRSALRVRARGRASAAARPGRGRRRTRRRRAA